MKVLLSWLREMTPVEQTAEELAELLTAKGVHIEGIEYPWAGLDGVVIARIDAVEDHPDSEKLTVVRLDAGEQGKHTVAAGVRNYVEGDLVPWARPGSRVPALEEPLQAKPLRGVLSEGMICSPRELALSTDHGGILVLPADAPVGAEFKPWLGLDDAVIDVEVEPNRPDLLSVAGVAREASLATGVPFTYPDVTVPEDASEQASDAATVTIDDLERNPRYVARLIRGVTIGPSPLAVQARLSAMGMRPISNVVDATNYAMLELGQPQHAFDLDLLAGHAIVVRRAADGERMVTLDDVERVFTSEDLMIADAEKSMGIAGVMGSAPAEVHAGTKDVLLESAYFQPRGVLLTARRLGLRTEASIRFERGVDPDVTADVAARCARFIAEWSGGRVLAGAIDVGTAPPRRHVSIRPSRTTYLLGEEVSAEEIAGSLGRLRMSVEPTDDGALDVEIPGYRPDIQREVDLIEEVARVRGYDSLGSTLPAIRTPGGLAPTHAFRRRVREALLRAGLREVRSVAFAAAGDLDLVGDKPEDAAKVANPIDVDRPLLRTSLIPGLLAALQRNLSRNVPGAALFEVGTRFRSGEPVDERELVALAMTGSTPPRWYESEREGDVFDAKGAMEALFASLGIRGWSLGGAAGAPFHPGRSAVVEVGEVPAGVIGELHPRVAAELDFPDRVALAELDVEVLRANAAERVTYAEIPRFPPVHRDLAFVVDAATPAGAVRMAIREAVTERGLDASVALFDVFNGSPVSEGRKSLAFSVDLRTPDRTLTDDEADAAVQAVVARLTQDFGAELRAG